MDEKQVIVELKRGSHLCSIYRDKDEQLSVIIPFLKGGLRRNERCIYIVDENTKEDISRILQGGGYDLEKGLARTGQLQFFTKEDSYLKDGNFDPDKVINLLKLAQEDALENGYDGLRVTGEMTWVLTRLPGTEKLIEYESKLNYFLPSSSTSALCQYNEKKHSEAILAGVLLTHPKVVLYGKVYDNPYYSHPDVFLAKKDAKVEQTYRSLKEKILLGG